MPSGKCYQTGDRIHKDERQAAPQYAGREGYRAAARGTITLPLMMAFVGVVLISITLC